MNNSVKSTKQLPAKEQLITIDEVAMALRVDRSTIFRNLNKLIAKGLQRVPMGGRTQRFRQYSLNEIIREAAETGTALF